MTIKQETRFITEDGKTFTNIGDARKHESWLVFLDWCTKYINPGSRAEVVALEMWEQFHITPKAPVPANKEEPI